METKFKILFIFLLLFFTKVKAQEKTTTEIVGTNGWEVLPAVDIYGNWFFDKENTYSRLGAGFQTFTISGNTHLIDGYNQIKADNLKNFFNILPADKRILKKYMGFRYRISKLIGNVSEIMIIVGVQDSTTYISNNSMGEYNKNPIINGEWREVKFETKAVTNRLTNFYKLRFETWVISPQAGYVSLSFDVNVLYGEDSLGVKTIYDGFDETEVENNNFIPVNFKLEQNYPNPFNPTTSIKFALPTESNVTLKIYNILGEEVANLVSEVMPAGNHTVNFDATGLSSGMHIYRIQANNLVQTKKMMLIK